MHRPSSDSAAVGQVLSAPHRAIVPVAALAAAGDLERLGPALEQGLDAGLSISEVREILVQLYAYAGFPRSLNALGKLLEVVDARRQRGVQDAAGAEPGKPIPIGEALLAAGTANQTRLAGAPVAGPLFDFAPQANHYLRTHLFGDIFERDNLDWKARELATVSMLAAIPGVESQLQSHMRMSMNVGWSARELEDVVAALESRVGSGEAQRARAALKAQLDARKDR